MMCLKIPENTRTQNHGVSNWQEGPLCKRNRNGLRTYQFILLSTELLYCEASSQAEKYEVHHAYPLARLRVRDQIQGKVGHEEDAFTILTPEKSFVVEAVDAIEKAEWFGALQVGETSVFIATLLRACLPRQTNTRSSYYWRRIKSSSLASWRMFP